LALLGGGVALVFDTFLTFFEGLFDYFSGPQGLNDLNTLPAQGLSGPQGEPFCQLY
jgi:hypothetical protein